MCNIHLAQQPSLPTPLPDSDLSTDPRIHALSHVQIPLCVIDVDSLRVVWANPLALAHWKAESLTELCGRQFTQGMGETVKNRIQQIHRDCYRHNTDHTETWTLFPKKQARTSELCLSPFPIGESQSTLLVQVLSELKGVEANTLHAATALMYTPTMVSVYDATYNLVYCNPAARDTFYDCCTTLTQRLANDTDIYMIEEALEESGFYQAEIEVNTANGVRWHQVTIQSSINAVTGSPSVMVSAVDATERRQARQDAYTLAYTDPLTGLPNRAALTVFMNELLGDEEDSTSQAEFGLFFLDLDRFKQINDSLGHAIGDQLLIEVAHRLKRSICGNSLVSRLGGDEFVVVLNQITNVERLTEAADKILNAMKDSVTISTHQLRILPSIGICSFPQDGSTAQEVIEHADAAMYMAKARQSGYCFYDKKITVSMNENIKDRLDLENDLVNAIKNNEFELYYQAKISCDSLEVTGVEALIRWNHPQRGQIPPDCFIKIAEETGLILELGNWVLNEAMRQQKEWQLSGLAVSVSINISAHQFNADDLLLNVSERLVKHSCDPSMIELEITESMLLGDADKVSATLHRLSSMGVRLALDDFGTGYSNLAYLQQYPLDVLKIDRIFLAQQKLSMLLGTILNMGKVLGLEVVAEGVETQRQAEWLIKNGCDHMQGFLYSTPSPAAQITEYLQQKANPHSDNKAA